MKMRDKPDYKNVFKCDCCHKIIKREDTVFTQTSYGGRAWLCENCAKISGISTEGIGKETPIR